MIVELLKPFGELKVGDITDKFSEGICRTLIDEGGAKASTEIAQATAAWRAESERRHQEQLTEIRTLHQGGRTTTGKPPGGKELVGTIERTEGPEERDEKTGKTIKRTFGEFCKMVALYQGVDTPHQLRALAHTKLRDRYGAEKCDYIIDEETGEISQTVSRSTDYGIETIVRTGTESLGGGPTYGFALKPEFMPNLFEIPMEQSVFAADTFGIPIGQALELKWPALDQYQPPTTNAQGIKQSAVFAGFTLSYVGETAPRIASDGRLSDIQYKILDLTGFTSLSRDLIADNYIAMDAMATRVFGRAFAWMDDYMGIQGSGLGQPEGFFNALALLTQTRGTSSHIEYEDIVGMMAQLHPMCWSTARWLTHTTCMTDLVAVKNHAGNLVYQPNTQISQVERPTVIGGSSYDAGAKVARPMGILMGLPLYFTEKVSSIGVQGDLNLVCPDQYGYATRAGLEVGLSEHFFFSTDLIAYRFKRRHDGKSLWRAPYTQVNGTTKNSPFIQLK